MSAPLQLVIKASRRESIEPGELAAAIEAAIESEVQTVVVDLTDCATIDSTALGILLLADRRLGGDGRALSILAATPETVRAFRITGLDRRLRIVADVAADGGGAVSSPGLPS